MPIRHARCHSDTRTCWESFVSSWYSSSSRQQCQQYDLTKRADGSIAISAEGVLKVLQQDGPWMSWAGQQVVAAEAAAQGQEQQQQLAAAREQLDVSLWASACIHRVHDSVEVNGVRFVGSRHADHAKQGWAVLRKEAGGSSMWFVEVLSCVAQPPASPGAASGDHVLCLCHLYESKPADRSRPGPKLESNGLIIFPSTPSTFDGRLIVAVAAAQLVPLHLAVVPHINKVKYPDTRVALKRIPYLDFVRAAGFPESSGYAGI